MHGRGSNVSAARSGVHPKNALVRCVLLNVLSLELVESVIACFLEDLYIKLRPLASCSETIELLNKLRAA